MFSRIQDLPRFKSDCKRFSLGIQGCSGEVQAEGQRLFDEMLEAVSTFDQATANLILQTTPAGHRDHAASQEIVQATKEAMEMWMNTNAPGVHHDELEFEQKPLAVEMDK
jgi:hypothetical protein